jgi:hypothetical protein
MPQLPGRGIAVQGGKGDGRAAHLTAGASALTCPWAFGSADLSPELTRVVLIGRDEPSLRDLGRSYADLSPELTRVVYLGLPLVSLEGHATDAFLSPQPAQTVRG